VFTHRRLALIKQLAAQVAISLTNARLYERLDVARIAAQSADRAKTRFLMNMSHELRTPLNAILGYTELIAENLAEGRSDTLDADLRSIHSAGVRLLRSVSSILELTRLETETHSARLTTVDPGPLVRTIAAQFAGICAGRNNTLEVDCPPDLSPITTDAHMLRYNLTSLLDNACRFTAAYAGSTPSAFKDPEKGAALATAQYASGVDVIFHASGSTGHGVFVAAHRLGRFAIGVDADQYDEMPGAVITSMLKRVDVAIFNVARDAASNRFDRGDGGMRSFGVAEGGIDYVRTGPHAALLAPAHVAQVEALRVGIVEGRVAVPRE